MKKLLTGVFIFISILLLNQSFAGSSSIKNQLIISQNTTSTKALDANIYRGYILVMNRGSCVLIAKMSSVHSSEEGVIIPAGGNWEPVSAPVDSIYLKSVGCTNTVNIVEGNI